MKGDFTRFTFQPKKHYSSVLMQQGRLQLDADWNEQMSILSHLSQLQTRDLIGSAAGTSQIEGGYQILPIADQETDFLITPGRFYVDGILCELNPGTPIVVERRSPHQIQVPVLTLDGQPFAENQWIELAVPLSDRTSVKRHRITRVNRNDLTLDLADSIDPPQSGTSITLKRLTTYKTQADFPNPGTPTSGIHLVYLDVWQRHVTSLDDRALQEVALKGLDTTTRLQTIAQIKLLNLDQDQAFPTRPSQPDLESLDVWKSLDRRAVFMNATTATNPASDDRSGNYLGGDCRLYRVEIHRGGTLNEATFKWSRDNGSIASAIAKIEGDVVYLKGSIQDEFNLFGTDTQAKENPWVELITEAEELNHQPGVLVQVRGVKPPNLLLLDPSQVQGGALPQVKSEDAEAKKYKARRWDNQLHIAADWQVLEQGIHVKFSSLDNARFQTGDYWLISARADQPIEWQRDLFQNGQLGQPIAQSPVGIQHHFGLLAVVNVDANGVFSPAIEGDPQWSQADFRTIFLPLTDRGNRSGIGTSPEASFHVRGEDLQIADGKIRQRESAPQQIIEITETKARIFRGYTLTIDGKTALVTDATSSATDGTQTLVLTLAPSIAPLPPETEVTPFRFQPPIVRFETKTATVPQFFINGAGNIGINTFTPTAKLAVRGIATDPTTALLQLQTADGTRFFQANPDGTIGVGIDQPQATLDVHNKFRVTAAPAFVQLQPGQPAQFTSQVGNSGYRFDQRLIVQRGGITVETGELSVKGDTILSETSGQERISVRGNAITLDGNVTIKNGGSHRIEVKSTETTINRDVNLATGNLTLTEGNLTLTEGNLTIANGTLTIGDATIDPDGIQKTRFNQAVTFANAMTVLGNVTFRQDGSEKITLDHPNSVVIDLPNPVLNLQSRNKSLVTLSNFEGEPGTPEPKLYVAGNLAIGTAYSKSISGLSNGLLVQGRVAIGSFDTDSNLSLISKLEVKGSTNDDREGALNVTNRDRTSLFFVSNDSRVYIAPRSSNPSVPPTLPNDLPLSDTDQQNIKLYTGGNTYVDGSLFAQKVEGGIVVGDAIVQVSSRSIKENITDLSSQEAIAMLNQLNPVKFSYIQSPSAHLHTGFIAEDVPDLLTSPKEHGVRILDLVAVLTRTLKDQQEVLKFLNQIVLQQQDEIAELKESVTQLSDRVKP